MDKPTADTCYWLDKNDRIVKVCEQWDLFAHENEGDKVLAHHVIGQPLWRFLSGDETRMWVEMILNRVRYIGQPVERPYRCDSDNVRRHLRLSVTPLDNHYLSIESTLVATEPRTRPTFFSTTSGSTGLHKRCSICGRVHHEQGWVEPDEIGDIHIKRLDYLVIYGVCEDCAPLAQFKTAPSLA